MKTTLAFLAAALAAGLRAGPAAAAGPGMPEGALEPTQKYVESQQKADEEGPDPDLEAEHYGRQLKLTDEQKTKVRAYFAEQRAMFQKGYEKRMKFQKETMELHEKIVELNKKFEAEGTALEKERQGVLARVRLVLNEKQKKTFDVMQEQRAKQERDWKERHEAEDRRRGGMGPMGEPHGGERR